MYAWAAAKMPKSIKLIFEGYFKAIANPAKADNIINMR